MSKYFSASEFKKCVPSCSIEDMDGAFLSLLDRVREKANIPLVLNCAYRSKEYDKSKGRSGNSAHTRGKAVDIRCATSTNRIKIVKAGWIPYVPPTPTEEETSLYEIARCKDLLAESDYKALKYAEGELSASEYEPVRVYRRELRERINELEASLGQAQS